MAESFSPPPSASPAKDDQQIRIESENVPPTDSSKQQTDAKPAPETEVGADPDANPDSDSGQSSEPTNATSNPDESANTAAAPQTWQAIYSPQHNAYYFYNTLTAETTWTNPLEPTPATPTPPASETAASEPIASTSTASAYAALQAAALAQGIDPSLAYLDPSLANAIPGAAAAASSTSFTAKFNARTGAFTRPDARDPGHLSEYERAKRMSEFYFDVGAWEKEVATRQAGIVGEEGEGEGRKRKRPTKKDLERFKEQKKQKKIAKTAWLRT